MVFGVVPFCGSLAVPPLFSALVSMKDSEVAPPLLAGGLRFTNNPKAASETVIPITSETRFRLVYTQRQRCIPHIHGPR